MSDSLEKKCEALEIGVSELRQRVSALYDKLLSIKEDSLVTGSLIEPLIRMKL